MKYLKRFLESKVWRYNEDEILKFLYDLDDTIKELNEREKDDECGWNLSYSFDDTNDTILIEFGYSGYSDGFYRVSAVYYNHFMGPTKVVSTENSSSPYGSYENNEVEEFDSYDDIIKSLRDHLGL